MYNSAYPSAASLVSSPYQAVAAVGQSSANAAAAVETGPEQMDSGLSARDVSDQASRASQQSLSLVGVVGERAPVQSRETSLPGAAGKTVAETLLAAHPGQVLKFGGEFALALRAETITQGEAAEVEGARLETLYSVATSGAFLLASQPGKLLVGAVPFDLPALEQAAEGFFARLDGLAGGGESTAITHGLPPWLLAATVSVTAAFELARRRAAAPREDAETDGGAGSPETSPELALLPPGR
jgi:hypothetical protein